MDSPIVLTQSDDIDFARLAAIKGALSLELKGMKRRGRSAYSIAKQTYALKGNRESVLKQLETKIEEAINAKQKDS